MNARRIIRRYHHDDGLDLRRGHIFRRPFAPWRVLHHRSGYKLPAVLTRP